MTFNIHTGKHRPGNWWKCIRLWYNKKSITRNVLFDFSAKYDLPGDDQNDVNKLFGIGYFPNHHKNSARFGWNWNINVGKINLFAYTWIDGHMSFTKLCELNPHVKYELTLVVFKSSYNFSVYDTRKQNVASSFAIPHNNKCKWCFWLGIYFGGNKPAPHPITIEMKKK
jgi:hypothetical protein